MVLRRTFIVAVTSLSSWSVFFQQAELADALRGGETFVHLLDLLRDHVAHLRKPCEAPEVGIRKPARGRPLPRVFQVDLEEGRQKPLSSPRTTASLMYGETFSAFSIREGETFFPPAVTMIAFFRSTIRRCPSGSSSATSPVCSQPSRTVSSVAFGVPVIPHEHPVTPLQQLPVLRNTVLDPQDRPAHRAQTDVPLALQEGEARAFRHPVPFQDRDADRAEEQEHLGRDGGGRGEAPAGAAQPDEVLQRPMDQQMVDEPAQAVQRPQAPPREPLPNGLRPCGDRPLEQGAPEPTGLLDLDEDRRLELSQILGTPRNTVGAISLRSSWIVRTLRRN